MAVVLVVDDEVGVAELILAVLEDEGHRVLIAVNGRQGLDALGQQRPDLMFLDDMMPVMDGAAVLRGVAENRSLRGMPIVMMSALPEAAVAKRCQGYAVFLRKPFRIAALVSLTARLLEQATNSGD